MYLSQPLLKMAKYIFELLLSKYIFHDQRVIILYEEISFIIIERIEKTCEKHSLHLLPNL